MLSNFKRGNILSMLNFEMTDRKRRLRPKVVPRATEDFVRPLKVLSSKLGSKTVYNETLIRYVKSKGQGKSNWSTFLFCTWDIPCLAIKSIIFSLLYSPWTS